MRTVLVTGSLLNNRSVPDHPVEPDARITELAEVLDLVDRWRGTADGEIG
jgi:hypothetical protein